MHNVDNTYTEILATNYKVHTALQIGRTDTVSIMTDAQLAAHGPVLRENSLFSMKSSANTFGSGLPTVGGCVAKTITVKMLEPDFDIPRRARLVPFSRIANAEKASKWIPKGVFYVDTRKKLNVGSDHPMIELKGYDAMMLTEQMYASTALGDKATDIEVVREIAGLIGVSIDSRTVSLMTKGIEVPLSGDYTYREVLGFIAACYGGNFVMSDLGELLLIPFGGVRNES